MMGSQTGRKDTKFKTLGSKNNPHNKNKKYKTSIIVETTFQKEEELGSITTQTLHEHHNQRQA